MKLSIIILNYNTRDLLKDCLTSLKRIEKEVNFETLVVDNGSQDNSVDFVKNFKLKNLKLIENKQNLGFAKGNNSARKKVKGEYVLFLNSDTVVNPQTLKETVGYLDENKEVGAITCKIVLLNGKLDKDARRSFPTPWVALTHFSALDRVFPKSRIFSRYWYGYRSENEIQEVDVLQGAFFMVRKQILDKVDWFDEDYFLDGEDIDLCWKIKESGASIIYYPKVSIIHVKKATKKKTKSLKNIMAGVSAMEIFYKKRFWERYPLIINLLVIVAVYLIKSLRFVKALLPIR